MSAFDLIALKQPLGRDDADRMSMPALLYLDAAKRGAGTAAIENGLIRVVVIAQSIGSIKRNKKFYDLACAGGRALFAAAARQRELLAFTTGEYQAMRAMIAAYVRVLPQLDVGTFVMAARKADATIIEMTKEVV